MLTEVMQHYGLTRPPVDAGFFETEHHAQVARDIQAAITRGGLIALTAIIGAGKTVLARRLRAELEQEDKVIVSRSLSLDKTRIAMPVLVAALFYDLSPEKNVAISNNSERRERDLQDLFRRAEQWGEAGKRAWYESASWRGYAAVKDPETAEELSETIGNYGVLAWSEAQNTGTHGRQLDVRSRSRGRNVTYSENIRPLIRPEEIMHDLREDAQIIIPKRGRPVLCGRAIYFRRAEFADLVAANRFFAGGSP